MKKKKKKKAAAGKASRRTARKLASDKESAPAKARAVRTPQRRKASKPEASGKASKSSKSSRASKGAGLGPDPASARDVRGAAARRRKGVAEKTQLDPVALRWTCPPVSAGSRQPSLSTLLGQDRPIAAMRTGLALHASGYNVFVSGTLGSGRTRMVTDLIRRLKPAGILTPDRVFVSNFREPNRPRLVTLARGAGPRFRDEMHELVHQVQDGLRAALRSRTHRVSHDLVLRSAEEREKRLMAALDRQAQKDGFAVVQFPGAAGGMMADLYPVFEGEPVNPEAFREIVAEGRISHRQYLRLRNLREQLMDRLEDVTERLLGISRDTDEELREMDRQVAEHVLNSHLRNFSRRWKEEEITGFLSGLREYILHDLDRWVAGDPAHEAEAHEAEAREAGVPNGQGPEGGELPPPPPPAAPAQPQAGRSEPVRFLGVEVHVVKSSSSEECPVVLETHPTYSNLFGVVEPSRDGQIQSLGQVHPGSLMRADGGYLILRLSDLMSEPGVWTQLKRAVKVGRAEIREFDPNSGITSGSLQPEALPITLKVILIGDPGTYETLAVEDPQFLQTFKVHAEFDTVMPATKGNMRRYADLIDWFRRQQGLMPFTADANAAVVEFGARRAGRRDRLTARYGELVDLAREASHICANEDAGIVTRAHVERALRARTYRGDLPRECVERDFRDGYLQVQTKGQVVGQINALTVIESDAMIFGKPSRVSVATGVGPSQRSGVVNIERESELSGPLHDKGVMILHGYLLQQFADEGPLSLQATICFEQTYGGVDGDSASSAELCALLSSLTGIPLDQGYGVTGALNQHGGVQAVSAVNEKIEGFFRLCRSRKLSGGQGVVLPRANVADLMLDSEVVAAVADGRFRIHAVDHVDEMMEILTGKTMAEIKAAAAERLRVFRKWLAT